MLVSADQSGVYQHSDVLAKLIADGLADSCSQVLQPILTSCLLPVVYTVFQKNVTFSTFTITSSDVGHLADFGHDYWSVNLQRPNAYLLVRNRIFSIVEYQLKCCSVADDAGLIATLSGLEQRVVDKDINEWYGRLHASVRADGRHFKHLF